MKTTRVPTKSGSAAATEKVPRLGARAQSEAPVSLVGVGVGVHIAIQPLELCH